jgi:hypothetical protein
MLGIVKTAASFFLFKKNQITRIGTTMSSQKKSGF